MHKNNINIYELVENKTLSPIKKKKILYSVLLKIIHS